MTKMAICPDTLAVKIERNIPRIQHPVRTQALSICISIPQNTTKASVDYEYTAKIRRISGRYLKRRQHRLRNATQATLTSAPTLHKYGSSLLLVGNPLFLCRFWSMLAHPINPMDGGRHWINAPSTNRFLGSQLLGLSQTLSLIKARAKS